MVIKVRVRVPTALRDLVAGQQSVVIDVDDGGATGGLPGSGDAPRDAVTVASALDALAIEYPALERRVRDELGRPRVHVNLFVGADNVRDLDGLATPITSGDDLSIIPAVSGG
jgi:molybdopterin converting factor small subunit